MSTGLSPDVGGQAPGHRFDALARLACAMPGVTGVVIARRSGRGWRVLGRAGAAGDLATPADAVGTHADRMMPAVAAGDVAVAIPSAGGGVAGALIVRGPAPDRAALELVASQAAALIELCDADVERGEADRRRRFASRLAARLRLARTPERVVAAAIDEVRSELGAESVSFGLLADVGGVVVETSHARGCAPGRRRMPLAAFGLDARRPDLERPVTFPTAASASVPLSTDGRLAALLHLQAPEPAGWADGDLLLAAEAAETLWRERARAAGESELRAGEGRLNAVLESVSDGFYALDADWRFTLFNRAAERFFGVSSARVVGRSLREVFPEVVRSGLEAHLAQVMATGVPAAIEMRSAARPDRVVEIRASPQGGGGIAVTFTDVTDRRARLEELHGVEARMTALLGQSRAGICETTLDGRFLSANPRFCEIVGRSETELLRLDQASITIPDDVPASLELCRRMVSTGEGFTIEKRYARPAGEAVEVSNAVGLLKSGRSTTALAVIVARGL